MNSIPSQLSNEQLRHITNEGFIYMCACPAAVAKQMLLLRDLHRYQHDCVSQGALMEAVHLRIAEATQVAHAELEKCLNDVLEMEGWDKTTLSMPEGLRQVRADLIDKELG